MLGAVFLLLRPSFAHSSRRCSGRARCRHGVCHARRKMGRDTTRWRRRGSRRSATPAIDPNPPAGARGPDSICARQRELRVVDHLLRSQLARLPRAYVAGKGLETLGAHPRHQNSPPAMAHSGAAPRRGLRWRIRSRISINRRALHTMNLPLSVEYDGGGDGGNPEAEGRRPIVARRSALLGRILFDRHPRRDRFRSEASDGAVICRGTCGTAVWARRSSPRVMTASPGAAPQARPRWSPPTPQMPDTERAALSPL